MTWALEQREVTAPTARHVLLCLANYADKDGKAAFPSASSLSEDTGLSVRTIRTALDTLREAGVIALGNQAIAAAYIVRHDRRPVVYDLVMVRGAATASGAERGAADDTTGCSSCANGVQLTTQRGAAAAPNPSFNHPLTVNEPKEPGAGAPPKRVKFDPLTAKPANVGEQAWADWCQHRKEIGKPLTAKSCEQQAKTLANHPAPDGVLATSISNGWTGIFPDRTAAASNVHPFTQPLSRHSGFDQRDYTDGLTEREDGTHAF
jgi:DNA-binding transcriptional ArsR family regulator